MPRSSPIWIRWTTSIALALALGGAALADEIGDPLRGKSLWPQCSKCHMVGPDARNRIGPVLNGIFGRRAASVDDFRYSRSIERAGADGLIWTLDTLDIYIENPKSLVSGTRMNFDGLDHPRDRADILAFLRLYSDSPSNIPESEPTARKSDPSIDPAILAIQGDPDYGAYLATECVGCHKADGADAGIPSITNWPVEDFVIALHAYRSNHRTNPAMQLVASRLSDEEIAALAAHFAAIE